MSAPDISYEDPIDGRPAAVERVLAWPGSLHLRWIVVGLGVALRIYWAITRPAPAIGEAANVALALAGGRGFADAYHLGQGPTAHLLPTVPLLAGGVYALLGPRSAASEAVLFALATLFVIGSFVFLSRAFARLGTPGWARTLALAYLCLLSPYLADEVISFRIWEGALAGFLAAVMLDLLVGLDRDPTATHWRRSCRWRWRGRSPSSSSRWSASPAIWRAWCWSCVGRTRRGGCGSA